MQQHMMSYPPDATLTLSETSQTLPWPTAATISPIQLSYGGLFPMEHDGFQCDVSDHQVVQPFGFHAELQRMTTAQDIMNAKVAASKSHSEAERRRRQRINGHLAKLRSLLPSTTKTDKASLLAEVIQHVKELKSHACQLADTTTPFPSENNELTVDNVSYEQGRWIIRASICCDDRSDLLPDLIMTLKALRLRVLKAEITSLGGRVRNVLFITGEDEYCDNNDCNHEEEEYRHCYSTRMIEEALKAVVEKSNGDSGSIKRQRTNTSAIEYRSL